MLVLRIKTGKIVTRAIPGYGKMQHAAGLQSSSLNILIAGLAERLFNPALAGVNVSSAWNVTQT
jgi:hypothetical protein